MPRKKRDIRRDYRQMGFVERKGKGSHSTVFAHPLVRKNFSVAGTDGQDAKRYDEENLREALRLLDEAMRRKQP
jgi:hypothetical protein